MQFFPSHYPRGLAFAFPLFKGLHSVTRKQATNPITPGSLNNHPTSADMTDRSHEAIYWSKGHQAFQEFVFFGFSVQLQLNRLLKKGSGTKREDAHDKDSC
jgi:hypothetical protein